MECNFESSVSTLKVDFGCSKDCPADVGNMLQRLKGVKAISIDPNQGTVTVVGNVNPLMLIKLLQKMGQKAQLWSFDKAPMKTIASCHPKQKQTTSRCCCESKKQVAAHCCCDSSDSEDDSDTDFDGEHIRHKSRHSQRSKKRHGWKDQFDYGNKKATAVTGYHPPTPGYQPFTGYHYHPTMPWYQPTVAYGRPTTYQRPVPWYGYYGRGQPLPPTYRRPSLLSTYNPMIRYTSYADNYRYTV